MPDQALYLKWRPLTFADVVGQAHVTRTLRNALRAGRVRHAYLFSGPRGTGKTTTARLLAKAVNCHHNDPEQRPCNQCAACIALNEGRYLDLIEIDAATHTGVDDVRDLRDKIAFAPGEGHYKVYIIDEVHRFTGNAFDALLKTLEEPPDHAIFVLATTEIEKVPPTIKSRCLQFEFRRVAVREVADRLHTIVEAEGLHIDRPALELIARQGTGSVRDSISLLDQIVTDPDETITLELVQRLLGTANLQAVRGLAEAITMQDAPRGLHIINAAVDSGSDPRQLGQQVVEHLRAVLLAQTASADLVEASQQERTIFEEQAHKIPRVALLKAIRAFNEAVNTYTGGWQPQLALELALVESVKEDETGPAPPSPPPPRPTAQDSTSAADDVPDEPPPVQTGEPPVISSETVREKWPDVQKATFRYNRNLPPLLEHVLVQHVDGNLLVLGVKTDIFLEKLSNSERIRVLEQALREVYGVDLRVQVSLVGSGADDPSAGDIDDPLLKTALDLGGRIHEDDE